MYRRYGAAYKDMMWAEETLERLEKKLLHGDHYTDKDRADFLKVKDIHKRNHPQKPEEAADGHITTHYIWHTQGDDRVRDSHAANNGKIFACPREASVSHLPVS